MKSIVIDLHVFLVKLQVLLLISINVNVATVKYYMYVILNVRESLHHFYNTSCIYDEILFYRICMRYIFVWKHCYQHTIYCSLYIYNFLVHQQGKKGLLIIVLGPAWNSIVNKHICLSWIHIPFVFLPWDSHFMACFNILYVHLYLSSYTIFILMFSLFSF